MSRSFQDKQTLDLSSHDYNIDRRLMERNAFSQSSYTDNKKKGRNNNYQDPNQDQDQDQDKYGEITGQFLKLPPIDKGMPMRSNMVTALNNVGKRYSENPHLDFNLYNEGKTVKVSSFDPVTHLSNQDLMFANVNDTSAVLFGPSSNTLTQIINSFTFDFLDKFMKNLKIQKSVILSPFSIIQSFSLLFLGSKGQTENLLKNYFNFPVKQLLYSNLHKINQELHSQKSFSGINLVCYDDNLSVNEAYKSYVNGLGQFIPFFRLDPRSSVKKINSLVAEVSGNQITNLLQPQTLQNNVLVLVNAITFKGLWKISFSPALTKLEVFHSRTENQVLKQVYMMSLTNTKHNYFEDTYGQILELETDNVFSMGFILPKQIGDPLISLDQYLYYVSNLQKTNMKLIKIPKFKVESRYSISNLFKKYGLKDIFQNLDISDIILPSDNNKVYVTDIIHAATIEVNEVSVKATASTTISMANSAFVEPKSNAVFIANHEFMYYIRNKVNNLILFVGSYNC